ncbi:hypothetical protein [Kitasatospora arboriphila]|uniref:Uncharacterized protein n=1 Tax=Kitasatospora arboriphila TaxID=258052 RepID=A0ABN1TK02_9ACTN
MTDDHTITSDDTLPAAAITKLAELKDLACAALNLLLQLDRAVEQDRAAEYRPHDGVTRWWG